MNVLCSGGTCHTQAAEIAHLRQQLATARGELSTARAALVQAQATAQEWQEAYHRAVEGKAFYEGLFQQATRKAVTA